MRAERASGVSLFSTAVVAMGLFLAGAAAYGQSTSASLAGAVRDAQGAPIAGARVSITSESRGGALETTTDSVGRFSFPQLQPATYTLKVEADGFKAFVK